MTTRSPSAHRSPSTQWPPNAIFTVGYSTLPIERFLSLLARYDIQELADIRKIPHSRRHPHFGSEALQGELQSVSINYVWLQALGGRHHARADSINTGWRNNGFRGYADYMQTDAFEGGIDNLVEISQRKRTAIMCAEAVPWRCHRSLVGDALLVRDVPVLDIFSETSCRPHTLTSFARVDGTKITYPPE